MKQSCDRDVGNLRCILVCNVIPQDEVLGDRASHGKIPLHAQCMAEEERERKKFAFKKRLYKSVCHSISVLNNYSQGIVITFNETCIAAKAIDLHLYGMEHDLHDH